MSEEKFDVIIVGGGIAGSVTALLLARAGLEVVMIERGNYSGAKNMTGGRLYSHCFNGIIPDFAEIAPIERKVMHERVSMMTETSNFTFDYTSDRLAQPGKESYIVLRGIFDRWLAEQAEKAGAMAVNGILVENLIIRDGKVCGVIAGEEQMFADTVVLADGANSQLTTKAGLQRKPVTPHQIAIGAKELFELDEKKIEGRFNLAPGEGSAWLFAGWPSGGMTGGGFIYTNKASVSLGIVVTAAEFINARKSVNELLEQFKAHSAVKPLIEGSKLIEYSGHMVAEGGYGMLPRLYSDGVVAVGDAAHLVINAGYTVRGMDLAVGSAAAAAAAIISAKSRGDFSEKSLSMYKRLLDDSFVMRDMRRFRKYPRFMENRRIFNEYPEMADEIFAGVFVTDGAPQASMFSKIFKTAKKNGLRNLAKDCIKGVSTL
ncbi:MAG: FAD-dependent oxidoreductase [Deferribacteraceae bacterium]|jgi:electron transfer flavoprotein-quinone oxidoreductase|nr:FAD-dependent oxidoreductase [Deferribacteraceae bacterium]